jgi:PadR family transcriptional regulator, regulatory protein PadR
MSLSRNCNPKGSLLPQKAAGRSSRRGLILFHLDTLKVRWLIISLSCPPKGAVMEKLDIPQGTLDLMILTILSREPMHGYGISQRLAALSHDTFQVNPGSLFPTLYRLEQDGKVKADWAPTENNRNAKYYKLTAAGRKQLEQHRQRWNRITFAITSVLEGA